MIGGRRPLQGRKPGDRRVRVDRPHAPYFRWTGAGRLVAKEAASRPRTAARPGDRAGPSGPLRAPAVDPRGDRGAAAEEEGAGHLQLGPDQLVGLRDRGDPAGARPRWHGRPPPEPADRGRHRPPPGGRLDVLPADRLRLPVGRRRLRGRTGEFAVDRGAHRRRGAARRLRHDGRGVHLVRRSSRWFRPYPRWPTSGS